MLAEKAILDLRGARAAGDGLRRAVPVLAARGRVHAVGGAGRSTPRARCSSSDVALHEIPLDRRTLHGHFSRDLEPVLTIELGRHDRHLVPQRRLVVRSSTERFEPREAGARHRHALDRAGRGARRAGRTDARGRIGSIRVGPWGVTEAGGLETPLNDRLGVSELEQWSLDGRSMRTPASAATSTAASSTCAPFLGVLGMPPAGGRRPLDAPPRRRAGTSTARSSSPARRCTCRSRSTARCSPRATATRRQGDGEVSQHAIECPVERAELTLSVRDDLRSRTPIAWTPEAWLTFGFDEDLDEAAAIAIDGMLELMGREHGLERATRSRSRASSSTCA